MEVDTLTECDRAVVDPCYVHHNFRAICHSGSFNLIFPPHASVLALILLHSLMINDARKGGAINGLKMAVLWKIVDLRCLLACIGMIWLNAVRVYFILYDCGTVRNYFQMDMIQSTNNGFHS